MARKSFEQAVDRIRQLDASEGQVAFEMGDEVLAQAPVGRDGAHNESGDILTRLAAETGVDYKVLEDRRLVSSRVPPTVRTAGVAWSVYRQIALYAPVELRSELFMKVASEAATQYVDGVERSTPRGRWTVDAILTHIGKPAANPAFGSARLLDRAFKEATPEAIDAVLEQPEIRRAVYDGLHRREEKVAERTERLTQADPISRGLAQQQAMLDLQGWVDHMRRQVERLRDDILPRLGKAPTRDPMALRRFLSEALTDLDDAISPVRTFVDSGTTDIDRFLSEVLGGTKNG